MSRQEWFQKMEIDNKGRWSDLWEAVAAVEEVMTNEHPLFAPSKGDI
jgi:hypothetical protein